MSAVCVAGLETRSSMTLVVQDGRFQVVFISPELLISCLKWRQITSPTSQTNLVAIAIDKALNGKRVFVEMFYLHVFIYVCCNRGDFF